MAMSSFKTFILVACIQQLTGLFGEKAKSCTGLLGSSPSCFLHVTTLGPPTAL